ncbi:DNA polymerase ligase-domain-containing protein [Hypomontagnella monticulosa]|nr:DNA polymerase ligase-domain-containing protein [Hypomontagnella monticulosa]
MDMATKRRPSLQLVGNPFIKKRNLEWTLDTSGLIRNGDESSSDDPADQDPELEEAPGASAVEAGKAKIEDHLDYFSGLLRKATLSPYPQGIPRLSIGAYRRLYEENSGNPKGAHFIVHQHDHPIAGTHYDLRLQINETSSASWAIMYGLPGDPNSQRLNRNATETRIHCLWNHLIETASHSTGSLLIWDTGTYTVLPSRGRSNQSNPYSSSSSEDEAEPELTERQKLHRAFQARKIRIRLNGTRLPHNYVLNLRLTKDEDAVGRAKGARAPARRRGRGGSVRDRGAARGKGKGKAKAAAPETSSDSDSDVRENTLNDESEIVQAPPAEDGEGISQMEREIRELEDEAVRRKNAYPGATNSIGSVHQRRWYLSLDREACGFVKKRRVGRGAWELNRSKSDGQYRGEEEGGDEGNRLTFPFYVHGAPVERSVVTGRTGAEVLKDEGVEDFVGRKGWHPVLN